MWDSKSDIGPALRTAGAWMNGENAESYPVLLELSGRVLRVLSVDGQNTHATWPLDSVNVDRMHEGQTSHLECALQPDALTTTKDQEFVRALVAAAAKSSGLPLGRRLLIIAIACALGAVALLVSLYFAAPWLSYRIARHIPVEIEQKIAPEVHALLAGDTCDGPGAEKAIAALLARLGAAERPPVQVRVVNLSMPNAFALPGGVVVLTRGLIEQAEGPDEVAGVMAHELSHVRHRHVLAHMIQNALLGAVWAVTLGDYSGLMVVDPQTAYRIATLRYSRDAEREADASALAMLDAARISPAGLAAFFKRNAHEIDDELAWLSSHPGSSERLRVLTDRRPAVEVSPSLDESSFKALKGACAKMKKKDSLLELFE